MKFFAALAFVLPVVSALAPTATTGKREFLSLNPDPASLPGVTSKRDFLSLNPDPASLSSLHISEPPAARRQTNADRLRRGLNPLSPRNLRRKGTTSHAHHPRQSPGVPTAYAGVLQARKADSTVLGYLGHTFNSFGEYVFTAEVSDAAPITFSASSGGGLISVTVVGAPVPEYTFLGGITGHSNAAQKSDIGTGSFNYAYIGGVLEDLAPGPATAQANSYTAATSESQTTESVMWVFDAATSVLSPSWINADGSIQKTSLVVVQGLFAITGDLDAFAAVFGPSEEVQLVYVPNAV